jgi:hypothetical protein
MIQLLERIRGRRPLSGCGGGRHNGSARASELARPPGRSTTEAGPRVQVLGIRGRPEGKESLREFADFNRSEMVDLIDDAPEAFAKMKGFRSPPKR